LTGSRTSTQLRFFNNVDQNEAVEIETYMDSIPIDDLVGKEVLLHIQTDI